VAAPRFKGEEDLRKAADLLRGNIKKTLGSSHGYTDCWIRPACLFWALVASNRHVLSRILSSAEQPFQEF